MSTGTNGGLGISRYDCFGSLDGGGPADEVLSDDGQYVLYDDALKLFQEQQAQILALQNALKQIDQNDPFRVSSAGAIARKALGVDVADKLKGTQ